MKNKVKVNIPGFGERYCSNNVEYKLFNNGDYYVFYKKGTYIIHNEYGPSYEHKGGSYIYRINNKLHRFNECTCDFVNLKKYYVIGKFIEYTKEEFIKKIANVLIPNNKKYI